MRFGAAEWPIPWRPPSARRASRPSIAWLARTTGWIPVCCPSPMALAHRPQTLTVMSVHRSDEAGFKTPVLETTRFIPAVSCPLLAFSAARWPVYQIFFKECLSLEVGSLVSIFAALYYLIASCGFAYRRPWTWRFSAAVLLVKSAGTFAVGALLLLAPASVGRSWRVYGIGFAFFSWFPPLWSIAWLFVPATYRIFGLTLLTGLHQSMQGISA